MSTPSRTEVLLTKADTEITGVRGYLVSLLELRRGPRRAELLWWAARLRRAADALEELAGR